MKRALLIAFAVATLFHLADDRLGAQGALNPLPFFKSYFVTGDYKVFGVGLDPSGSGSIDVSGVPAAIVGNDVVAAFLYWQAVTGITTPDAGALGVRFKGNRLDSTDGTFAKALGPGTATCSSNGGGTGSSNGSKKTFTYRVDVLRYFNVDPTTGKLVINGSHSIQVPSNNNVAPLGASLVIVYRQSGALLRSVVLYNGAYSMDNSTEGISLTLRGFYDGKTGPGAKLTYIGGSGQSNKNEITRINGTQVATNAFSSSAGPSWDNPTFSVNGSSSQVTTSVGKETLGSFDCVTFAAVVYSTEVNDTDGDGLLDIWERSTTTLTDPNGQPLPNLNAMGATPDEKDLFVEIGYMQTGTAANALVPYSYGGISQPAHSHLPGHESLKLIGDALAGGGIRAHFDVGQNYPVCEAGQPCADTFIIGRNGQDPLLARGGEAVDEAKTACQRAPGDPEWVCQYSAYPGTVGWKTGFRFLRDEVLVQPPLNADGSDPCDVPGACQRRFDENRLNTFHYTLFAHFVGLPKSELPCLNGTTPVAGNANDVCVAPLVSNPDFHVPRTNSGIGDFPGGDSMVTLGGFADLSLRPIGTPFMQAATFMHELGHNFERRHGGPEFEPNCKPTYLSVMNYMYQLRGLLDDDGQPHLSFSGARPSATVNEGLLVPQVADAQFRLGWYAPLDTSYLRGKARAASKHCNGSDLLGTEVPMVRVDARLAGRDIDWDADGLGSTTLYSSQDVNFSGNARGPETLRGSESDLGAAADDWPNLLLNQIGSRRNVGALYLIPGPTPGTFQYAIGAYSIGMGKGDVGKGDVGKGDVGKGDVGKGDVGKGDVGKGDVGKGDVGKGDVGKGDVGGGDLFLNDPNNPPGDLDAETSGDLNRTPPKLFAACVIGETCTTGSTTPRHRVRLTWQSPNVPTGLASYLIYRVQGAEPTANDDPPIGTVPAVLGQASYEYVDPSSLVDGQEYSYFAIASYGDGIVSDASRVATITAFNDPLAAGSDSYSTDEDTPLTVTAPGVLVNDGDPDDACSTLTAVSASALSPAGAGSLTLNGDGSFTFTPAANFNTGGGAPVTFTYRAQCGSVLSEPATVSIAVAAVNDVPVAGNDVGYGTAEDTPLVVAAPGVLGNDTDIESQASLTAALVTGPSASQGTLALAPNGGFTFTPAAEFSGPVTFTYQASDGAASSSTATVTILVSAVDDPPVARPDSYDATEDTARTVGAPGVLVNDSDVDSSLTAVIVTGPSHGTLSLAANGGFTYTPTANYNGLDSFTYSARGGTVNSTAATVSIAVAAVNDTPTITNIADTTIDANANTGPLSFIIGDVDGLTGATVTGTSSNTTLVPDANIVLGGSGASRIVTVTAAANQAGSATITVRVTDAGGLSASDSFVVTVRPNNTFVAVRNLPPGTINAGSSKKLEWKYVNGSTLVDSSAALPVVEVVGPCPASGPCTGVAVRTFQNTDPGGSGFGYSGGVWSFNLQTKAANGTPYPVGLYQVTISSRASSFPASPTYTMQLR